MHDTLETDVTNGGTGTFLIGMLCGAAVGAAIGLMVAPKAGNEMRRQLWESTEGLRQKAASAYQDASVAVNDVISRGRQAVDAGRETFQRNRPGNGPARDMTSSMP
jgi:gas vesicle protein